MKLFNRCSFVLVGILFFSIFFSSPIQAVVINPTADTYIKGPQWGDDNVNFGGAFNMLLGAYVHSGEESRMLMEFDLSSFSGTVASATLNIYRYYKYYYQPLVTDLHRVTQPWVESSVTWNKYDGVNSWASSGGDFDATIIDATTMAATGTNGSYPSGTAPYDSTWYQYDITNLAQDWIDSVYQNNGLLIRSESMWHVMSGIYSTNYSNSLLHPFLDIQMEGGGNPVPEPSTLLLISLGLGVAGIIKKRTR